MKHNDNIQMIFDIEGYSPTLSIAYIFHKAKVLNFFDSNQSDSDYFESYQQLMEAYTKTHGSDYIIKAVAPNMERLYTVEHSIDGEIKAHIDGIFDQLKPYIPTLLAYDLGISLGYSDTPGRVLMTIPVPEQGSEDKDQTDTPNVDSHPLPPEDLRQQANQAFKTMFHTMLNTAEQNPNDFAPILSRLNGVDKASLNDCHAMIRIVFDCLMDEVDFIDVPHWSDIAEFLYNFDGESPMRLNDYLLKRQEWLADGLIPVIPYHGQILKLLAHFNSTALGNARSPQAQPLSLESQWLLAYADFFHTTGPYQEGGH